MKPVISIVVPVYNEEKSIRLMYDRLIASMSSISSNFEIIYVNDGSRDNSFLELVSYEFFRIGAIIIALSIHQIFQKSLCVSFHFVMW